jgi:phenylacetic acid degradation operon negative regulatory protein
MRIKRQLTDPRAIRDQASGAVIFAFGASGVDPRPLPGPALVAILGAIGMSEPTARATILRMRRRGWLTSARRGPVVEYALSDPARALARATVAPIIGPRPTWNGAFEGLLFTVPERERSYRDALRRAAQLAGFGVLSPGLLVTPEHGRWARIEAILAQAPANGRFLRVELRFSPEDARTAAAEAWPLGTLAGRYRRHAADLLRTAQAYRDAPPSGAEAARIMFEAMTPISATAIEDPNLPLELLPPDWPGALIREGVEAMGSAVGLALLAFIEERVAAVASRS